MGMPQGAWVRVVGACGALALTLGCSAGKGAGSSMSATGGSTAARLAKLGGGKSTGVRV